MTEELIRTTNLTKIYGSGEASVRALDGVNLVVPQGELLAVMGPSGCGKSTLLNMLGALDQPTSGEVWVAGENLARLKNVDAFRAKTVGFVFQLHNLLPTLTAQENVEVPMQGRRARPASGGKRAKKLLEMVGLGERGSALPGQLSGGQRQRVAVARALANGPALILADEPTGSLDTQSGEEMLALLADLNRTQGTTIVDRHPRPPCGAGHAAHRAHVRWPDRQRPLLLDPLEEDLRTLADSRLGQAILGTTGWMITWMQRPNRRCTNYLSG